MPNYVPVTDAMLRNPDPGDWLMIRRDYFASDYSPLNQITRDNVKDLQLVCKSPMHEGGTNQPAPIVHNGIIYLANTGGIIQALDGATGKVIWENHLGSNIAMRGIQHLSGQALPRERQPRHRLSTPATARKSGTRRSPRAIATPAVLS